MTYLTRAPHPRGMQSQGLNPLPCLGGAAPPEAPLALGRGKAGARVRAQAVRETHLHHWRVGGSSSSCLIAGVRSDGSFSVAVKGVYRKGIQTDEKAFFFFLLPVAVILVSWDTFENIFSVILLCKVRKHLLSSLNSQEWEEAKDQVVCSFFFFF